MTTSSSLFKSGLMIKSDIENLFKEKKFSKNLEELSNEISQKDGELLMIKKDFKKELLEKIISENPEIKDFMNADCSSSFYGSVGGEISFTITMQIFDVYINQDQNKKIHTCFKSSILDMFDLKYLKSSIEKIKKTVFKNYSVNLDISFKRTIGLEKDLFYSLSLKKFN